MSKIDTSSWKEFKLADIAKLENGNKLDIGKMTQLSPSINFVSRTAKNNGVSSIVDKIEGIEPYPAGCLTLAFGGSVGSCFLQEKPFYTGQNVGVIMFSEEISLEAKRYIATSLGNKCKLSYQAFGNEINRHFKTDLSVKLPAIETYEPDWQYMEEYMKNIESEVTLKIDKFQTILDNEKHKIDTQKWGGYRIGDLFEIKISKSVNKIDLNFTSDGKYDFIGRTSTNNGVQGHMEHIKISPNPKQTFSVAQIGENICLYRDNEWYSSQNIFCLTPKYIELIQSNKFITSVITKQLKATFGLDAYSNYPTLKTLSTLIIKLPTLDGKPDWDYMEKYMKNIENKVIHNIDSIEMGVLR